jgi:PadR family transcriptional regulator, regulatory protein PadR
MKPDRVKGHLELLVLAVLSTGPTHGYAVINQLRDRSGGELDLPEGSVYPALHRLEDQGALAAEWRVVEGRRRKVYRLTPEGVATLADQRRDWRALARAIEAALRPTSPILRPVT